jgi:hypothetical protein
MAGLPVQQARDITSFRLTVRRRIIDSKNGVDFLNSYFT